jgi:L-ascorbate 6-phosphate lactonase
MKTPTMLWREIQEFPVKPRTVVLWWLYQAGFVLKSPGGSIILVDPYLSDAVRRSYKIPRNAPATLDAAEVAADAILATHSHEDHLDPDSIVAFSNHEKTVFIGPPMVTTKLASVGVTPDKTLTIERGASVPVGDFAIRAVYARHLFGLEPTPDAIGFVIECGGVTIYHSGDTEYDSEIVNDTRGVTAALISINGTTGNMNAQEAAMLAWRQEALLAVPMHYGLWRNEDYGEGATLEPSIFVDTYHRLKPDGQTLILEAAHAVVLNSDGDVA